MGEYLLRKLYRTVQHLKAERRGWWCVRPFVPGRRCAPFSLMARAVFLGTWASRWARGAAPADWLPTPVWVPLSLLNTRDASLRPFLRSLSARSVAHIPGPFSLPHPHLAPFSTPLAPLPAAAHPPPPPKTMSSAGSPAPGTPGGRKRSAAGKPITPRAKNVSPGELMAVMKPRATVGTSSVGAAPGTRLAAPARSW